MGHGARKALDKTEESPGHFSELLGSLEDVDIGRNRETWEGQP